MGDLLGQTSRFFTRWSSQVRGLMQDAYPELERICGRVSETVQSEETTIRTHLDIGLARLEDDIRTVLRKRWSDTGSSRAVTGG